MATVPELIEKLKERLIMGEISEGLYYQLKEELETKLDSTGSNSSTPYQSPSLNSHQSPPVFDNMFMSGNPDGIGSQESSMNSASGSSRGSELQVDAGIQLQPGDKLGNQFIISKYLSKGGFGSVYQAYDSMMEEDVALKIIFPELGKEDTALKQLINEVRSRSRISYQRHILRISTPIDFIFNNLKVIALPMELASGGNLRDYLNSKPSDISDADWEKQSIHFFKEACKGVKAIHRAGFTHQDIKPDNLLICKDPETGKDILKVADFGLAKAKNKVKGLKRGAGTPAYMSPEQFYRRAKDIMPNSDVYALGCVLFELLDGDPPIEASTRDEYARLHKEQAPFLKRIPKKYQSVIEHCLEKDSDDRYQNAAELLEAIEEIPKLEEAKRRAEEQRKADAAEKLRRKEEARLEAEERRREEKREKERLERERKAKERLRKEEAERKRQAALEQARQEQERKEEAKRRKEAEARKWESFSGGRFLRHQDTKIIQDKKTGLEWVVGPDKDTTHYDAGNWVDSLGNNWRMPSKHELKDLFNSGITDEYWGPFENSGYFVWSKEIKPGDSSLAWDVNFYGGLENCFNRGADISKRAFAVRPRG